MPQCSGPAAVSSSASSSPNPRRTPYGYRYGTNTRIVLRRAGDGSGAGGPDPACLSFHAVGGIRGGKWMRSVSCYGMNGVSCMLK